MKKSLPHLRSFASIVSIAASFWFERRYTYVTLSVAKGLPR